MTAFAVALVATTAGMWWFAVTYTPERPPSADDHEATA